MRKRAPSARPFGKRPAGALPTIAGSSNEKNPGESVTAPPRTAKYLRGTPRTGCYRIVVFTRRDGRRGANCEEPQMRSIRYRKADVDGLKIFYREAGPADAPVLLLLHGFPTAGHMFRELIPALSGPFRVVAPDLPGFGQSDMPDRGNFAYTFAALAQVI